MIVPVTPTIKYIFRSEIGPLILLSPLFRTALIIRKTPVNGSGRGMVKTVICGYARQRAIAASLQGYNLGIDYATICRGCLFMILSS
jgi:hypothetical protein